MLNLVVLGLVATSLGARYVHGRVQQGDYLATINAGSEQLTNVEYVDARQPGPRTAGESLRIWVALPAWYELCPFQPAVHRPVGGSSDDGGD